MAKHNKNTSIAASQKNTYVRAWHLHVVLISCFYLHIRVESVSFHCCTSISVPIQAVIVALFSHVTMCGLGHAIFVSCVLSNKFVLILTSYTSDRFTTCHQISIMTQFRNVLNLYRLIAAHPLLLQYSPSQFQMFQWSLPLHPLLQWSLPSRGWPQSSINMLI